jgi:hypothetical protein
MKILREQYEQNYAGVDQAAESTNSNKKLFKGLALLTLLATVAFVGGHYYRGSESRIETQHLAAEEEHLDETCISEDFSIHEKHGGSFCTSACNCDGKRTCVKQHCNGVARAGSCLSEDHKAEERKGAWSGSKCNNDCECAGRRRCSAEGRCEGTAFDTCQDARYFSEETDGKCGDNCDCDGLRTCVSGVCKGTPREGGQNKDTNYVREH